MSRYIESAPGMYGLVNFLRQGPGGDPFLVLLRYEDLVRSPCELKALLNRMGHPHNSASLFPLCRSLQGSGVPRAHLDSTITFSPADGFYVFFAARASRAGTGSA